MGLLRFVLSSFLLLQWFSFSEVSGNAELSALMEMKSALDPENRVLISWTNQDDPCSSFQGIVCNAHGKVANISLAQKGLTGKISPAVSRLECLSGLYLHFNNLTGRIPVEIGSLSELSDLWLNENNLSGSIPPQIGNLSSIQVLQLSYNQLDGEIPAELGSLKKLMFVSLQNNALTGPIPASLGNLAFLNGIQISFNQLTGPIPSNLADLPVLEILDVQNNNLSGLVPPALKRLKEKLLYANNPHLCGVGFSSLRPCSSFDYMNADLPEFPMVNKSTTTSKGLPEPVNMTSPCNHTRRSGSSKFRQVAVIVGIITLTVTLSSVGYLTYFRYRRHKQKIGSSLDNSDDRVSTDQAREFYSKSASPLVYLEYSRRWDPMADDGNDNDLPNGFLHKYRFNLEEVESATQYFSEMNLLGRSNFSAVYKGILRDGSLVAIRTINVTSCKSEEADFIRALNLLASLKHENLVRFRGFCCAKARGECFLIYDLVTNGNLAQYIDAEEESSRVLNWSKRVSIIEGIAKGIRYLHRNSDESKDLNDVQGSKPAVVHQNIATNKILIDQHFTPLMSDSGLPGILADDVIFSALKVSAAMGYLAPEYITTGRFTAESDIYAFGVIILQILCGKHTLSNSIRLAAENCKLEEFIDPNLKGKFSKSKAAKLTKISTACTRELPELRPTIEEVIQELSNGSISA